MALPPSNPATTATPARKRRSCIMLSPFHCRYNRPALSSLTTPVRDVNSSLFVLRVQSVAQIVSKWKGFCPRHGSRQGQTESWVLAGGRSRLSDDPARLVSGDIMRLAAMAAQLPTGPVFTPVL